MSNHAHLITSITWVWLLKPEVFNVLKGPEARLEGRGQATPTTATSSASRIPIFKQVLTGHRKPTNNPTKNAQHPQGQNATHGRSAT